MPPWKLFFLGNFRQIQNSILNTVLSFDFFHLVVFFHVSVIAVKLQSRTYLTALLPKDQIYDEDEEPNLTASCKKSKNEKVMISIEDDEDDEDPEDEESNFKGEPETIDNPYLRAVRMCPKWNSSRKMM